MITAEFRNKSDSWWRKALSCSLLGHELTLESCPHRAVVGDSRRHQKFTFLCVKCGYRKEIDSIVPTYTIDKEDV
jgi:hypothetical protein